MENRTYLMHAKHKYLRKEFRNGKWRYYYYSKKGGRKNLKLLDKASDLIGEDEREQLNRMKKHLEIIRNKSGRASKEYIEAEKAYNDFLSKYQKVVIEKRKQNSSDSGKGSVRTLVNTINSGDDIMQMVMGKYLNKKKNNMNTARNNVASLAKSAIDTKNAIKDASSAYDKTLLGKVDKAKSWLSKKFKRG